MSSKWLDRDRKKNKKSSAKKINAQYKEKGKGKDSARRNEMLSFVRAYPN